ncbi:MAG: helix-hairpin-helix domain-containing protein [Chitinophagales bacterium]
MILISVLALSLPQLFAKFKKEEKISDEELIAVRNILAGFDSSSLLASGTTSLNEIDLFYFNPNTASKQEWIALGLQENIAQRIVNFTSKGGKFYRETDLLKTYGFTQTNLDRLAPFMIFEEGDDKKFTEKNYDTEKDQNFTLFLFNPNTISKEQWVQLGIKDYVADRLVNFVSKGGKFKTPEDLLKTYGFQQQDYERLKDYMLFDDADTQIPQQKTQTVISSQKQITEINIASKDQLIALGFSNYNANGIITYREQLGGFYKLDQLKDVYKIDLTTLNDALPFLKINNTNIQKININTASFEQLEKHAYISEKVALAIVDYRNTKGNFIILSELQSVKGIYPELFEKLKPYLTL